MVTKSPLRNVITLSLPTLESARATQLYRTLLHEIGYHIDWERDPEAFDRKIPHEKEAFAHRYADALREELRKKNVIPFERLLVPESIEHDGLRMSDFVAT